MAAKEVERSEARAGLVGGGEIVFGEVFIDWAGEALLEVVADAGRETTTSKKACDQMGNETVLRTREEPRRSLVWSKPVGEMKARERKRSGRRMAARAANSQDRERAMTSTPPWGGTIWASMKSMRAAT